MKLRSLYNRNFNFKIKLLLIVDNLLLGRETQKDLPSTNRFSIDLLLRQCVPVSETIPNLYGAHATTPG